MVRDYHYVNKELHAKSAYKQLVVDCMEKKEIITGIHSKKI